MHDVIEKFSLSGEIKDSNIVKVKERLVHWAENSMRDQGAVPALDIEPQFTLDYVPDTETYSFNLTVYGIDVGGEDAWQISGIMGGKTIFKYTTNPK